jgi:hypothetical protein
MAAAAAGADQLTNGAQLCFGRFQASGTKAEEEEAEAEEEEDEREEPERTEA